MSMLSINTLIGGYKPLLNRVASGSGINLNSYMNEGCYSINVTTTTSYNFPTVYTSVPAGSNWNLTVLRQSDTGLMQLLNQQASGETYYRYYNSGTWSAWQRVVTTENIASVDTSGGKQSFTSYGTGLREVQSNFNNCMDFGIGLCSSSNAPTGVGCSQWGFMNLPASMNGSTTQTSILQIAWCCGNHTSYPVLYYRHYNGGGSYSNNWSPWNPVGHLAT